MNVLATIRNIRKRGARSALTLGILAWLGFLLQPCVMAATPPGLVDAVVTPELSIVTHHGQGMPAEECLHCGDATATSRLLPESCDEPAASSHSPSAKPFDAGGDGWNPAVPIAIGLDSLRDPAPTQAVLREEHLPRPVSFTVAYCVFLE